MVEVEWVNEWWQVGHFVSKSCEYSPYYFVVKVSPDGYCILVGSNRKKGQICVKKSQNSCNITQLLKMNNISAGLVEIKSKFSIPKHIVCKILPIYIDNSCRDIMTTGNKRFEMVKIFSFGGIKTYWQTEWQSWGNRWNWILNNQTQKSWSHRFSTKKQDFNLITLEV